MPSAFVPPCQRVSHADSLTLAELQEVPRDGLASSPARKGDWAHGCDEVGFLDCVCARGGLVRHTDEDGAALAVEASDAVNEHYPDVLPATIHGIPLTA